MSKTDLLFQLIKSLSKGEKRNFKVLTQLTSGNKKYLQLFDALDRAAEYKENQIIKDLEDEDFTRQFSVAKNYLYNNILKSLAYFYKGQISDNFSLSLQTRILIEKRLFSQASKLLVKALDRAEKQENFYELLQLYNLQRIILRQTGNFRILNERLHEINFKEKLALEKLNNLHDIQFLLDKLLFLTTHFTFSPDKPDSASLLPIIEHPLMESEGNALSIKAKIRYWTILHRYHRHQVDRIKGLPYLRNIVNAYEANQDILEDEWLKYVDEICHLVADSYSNGFEGEAFTYLKKLEYLKGTVQNGFTYHFANYYSLLLIMSFQSNNMDKAYETIADLEKELPKHVGQIPKMQEMKLYLYCAMGSFFKEDWSKGIKWLNLIMNEPKSEISVEILGVVRVLKVILHFENKDNDILESEIRSASRFLFKHGRLFDFEQRLFSDLRRWTDMEKEAIPIKEIEALRAFAVLCSKDKFQNFTLALLDIATWLQSRVQKESFLEVRKQKMGDLVPKNFNSGQSK